MTRQKEEQFRAFQLTMKDRDLWEIATALRGPDAVDCDDYKFLTAGVIRFFADIPVENTHGCYVANPEEIMRSKDGCYKRSVGNVKFFYLVEARTQKLNAGFHYSRHFHNALRTIAEHFHNDLAQDYLDWAIEKGLV